MRRSRSLEMPCITGTKNFNPKILSDVKGTQIHNVSFFAKSHEMFVMHGISRGRDLRIRWTENTYSALMSRWNFEEEKITMKMSLLLSDSLPVKFLQQMLLSYNFWPNVVAIMASRSLMLSVAKVAFCRKSACKTGNFLNVSDVLHFVVGICSHAWKCKKFAICDDYSLYRRPQDVENSDRINLSDSIALKLLEIGVDT